MKKAIIVSGYFNPLHKGHIEYFLNAKKHGDRLFVIVNSDYQRKIKGSKEFMNEEERIFILNQLKIVDKTFISIDKDRSVCETIKIIHKHGVSTLYGHLHRLNVKKGMNVTEGEEDTEHLLLVVIAGNAPKAEFTDLAYKRINDFENSNN